ncbi:hypothetical protein JXA40_05950 [bacterium]|nr:hypothetical protein [candidate division CSSED10-310 bacterium]
MVKLIVFIALIAIICLLIVNYVETGTITLFPRKTTPREQEIRSLEKKLKAVEREMKSLEDQARMIGLAVPETIDTAQKDLIREKEALEAKLRELKGKP